MGQSKEFCRLDELGYISRGRSQHRPRNAPHLYGGEFPFIQTADITRSNLYISDYSQTYTQAGVDQSRMWEPGVLCIANAGVNTGDNAILSFNACFPDSVIGFIANRELCEVRYIKYFLDSVKSQIRSITMGATQDNLSVGKLLTIPIPKLPLVSQKKIAAILSAYDDLIENNKRRIAILEKMAEEIYREWFVRFRFPGYQDAEFEKGIPKGWGLKSFRELVSYYIGGGWGEDVESSTFSKGAFVIRGTDIPPLANGDYSNGVYRFHKPSNFKSRKLQPNDFVFEVSGGSKDQLLGRNLMVTEGLIEIFGGAVICASFCKQIRFNEGLVSPFFMKYFLKLYYECDLVGIYQVQSTGISNYQFESFLNYQTVSVPPVPLLKKFEDMVKPIVRQQETLAREVLNLQVTKNLLLPRLISGKLSVENLNITFPPSMQEVV